MKLPTEVRDEFLEACKNNKKMVTFRPDAVETAKAVLKMQKRCDILDFLVSDDVSNFRYENTSSPRDVHMPGITEIHAWLFDTTSVKNVYLAFGQNKEGVWSIKSLHESNGKQQTSTVGIALGIALGRAIKPKEEQ